MEKEERQALMKVKKKKKNYRLNSKKNYIL
jgi:hypothetical protein